MGVTKDESESENEKFQQLFKIENGSTYLTQCYNNIRTKLKDTTAAMKSSNITESIILENTGYTTLKGLSPKMQSRVKHCNNHLKLLNNIKEMQKEREEWMATNRHD